MIDIGYITTIYFILGAIVANIITKYQTEFNNKNEDKKTVIRSTLSLILLIWINGVLIYFARNIVELIPYPFDDFFGFHHKKVKELGSATAFTFVLLYYQPNLNKMMKSNFFNFLDGVVIGRSDLAGSLYLSKSDVDSKKIFNKVEAAFKKIKNLNKKNFIFKMGGSITPRSKIFINKLYLKKLLHRVETRNVEIKLSKKTIENIDKIVIEIFKFELDWLKYKLKNVKKENNELLFDDYSSRIIEMTERLKKNLNV